MLKGRNTSHEPKSHNEKRRSWASWREGPTNQSPGEETARELTRLDRLVISGDDPQRSARD